MPIADSYEPLKSSGNGTTVDFSFDFYIGAEANLRVYEEDDVTGVQTLKALTTDYTVVFDDKTPGGTVTFGTAPASGKSIIRARAIPKTQETSLKTSKGFQALVLQNMIDKVTALVQDVYEAVNRAVKLPLGTTITAVTLPAPEDDHMIAWVGVAGDMKNVDMADFKGDTGDTGPTGPAGADGEDGEDGVDGIFSAIASEAEAQAGTENTKGMTPLRTAQAIAALGKELGDWDSKSLDTVYQAATDGFVVVISESNGQARAFAIYSDGSNPPTTMRAYQSQIAAQGAVSFMCPIRSGDYYKVYVGSGTTYLTTVYWIPLS
jgi:hypothetical protein